MRDDKDLCVARDEAGDVLAVISCDKTEDAKRHPGCNHDFRARGVDVRASYRSPDLKDWARIQADISDFIGCALDNPM